MQIIILFVRFQCSSLHEQLTVFRQKKIIHTLINYTLSFMPFDILLHHTLNLCVGLSSRTWATYRPRVYRIHTHAHSASDEIKRSQDIYVNAWFTSSFFTSISVLSINDLVRTSRPLVSSLSYI